MTKLKRREFSQRLQLEIKQRATRDGVAYCEKCGLPAKKFHIDHIIADALEVDRKKKLTAADGQLLCAGSRQTCHGIKTAEKDVPAIRQAERREQRAAGVVKPGKVTIQSAPFPAPPVKDKSPPSKTKLGIGGKWIYGVFYPD